MTVKTILSRKGNDVVTISPTARLFDAVKILDAHRIGAVVRTTAATTTRITLMTDSKAELLLA